MTANLEQRIARPLLQVLDHLPTGADIPDSEQFRDVLVRLECYLPAILGEVHPECRELSWDGILPMVARKTGGQEGEILGHCYLLADQSLAPLCARLQIDPSGNELSWLEIRLGRRGPNGMLRGPEYKQLYASRDCPDATDWAYKATFGDKTS